MTLRIGSPPQSAQPKSRKRWPFAVPAALVGIAVGGIALWALASFVQHAAAVIEASPSTTGMVRGVVILDRGEFTWSSETSTCWGINGYDDLTEGAQVTVTDAAGKTIALGRIVDSSPQTSVSAEGALADSCTLSFEVPSVPKGAGFYGVEVSHRGVVREAEGDLFSTALRLTLR